MYKIYINDTRLILAGDEELPKDIKNSEKIMVTAYPGQKRYLLNYIDMIEKSSRFDKVYIHHSDFPKLKADFKSLFRVIPAAGGMVINDNKEVLFIFRRGAWDLPKGKMEKGESRAETALREVEEETGILDLELDRKLMNTKHMYKSKSGRRLIKKSYWYLMKAPKQDLIPQTEEDIEKAVWMTIKEWQKEIEPTYENIKLVLRKGIKHLNKVSIIASEP